MDVVTDPCTAGGLGETLRAGERMPPLTLDGLVGQVLVHVEERGAGDVTLEVELPAVAGVPELPAAVDELVARSRDGGYGSVQLSAAGRRKRRQR